VLRQRHLRLTSSDGPKSLDESVEAAVCELGRAARPFPISRATVRALAAELRAEADGIALPTRVLEEALSRRPHFANEASPFAQWRSHSRWVEALVRQRYEGLVAAACEGLARLATERSSLTPLIGAEPTSIRTLRRLGDETHNGARFPLLIEFDRGGRLVYKPRSLRPEQLFAQCLALLHAGLASFERPRALPVISRSGFGFERCVPRQTGRSSGRLFYRRAGVLLALCYALNVTDLHLENVPGSQVIRSLLATQ
jgi:hypothetical protein